MIVAALAAAVLYGAGTAMEQRQAAAAPQSSAGRLRLLFLLGRQPLWLAGIAMQAAGFAAHAVALRSGPLAAVQVLMSAELIVAVVIVRIWSGRRLSRGAWAAALTVTAAIAAFLLAVSPGHGHAVSQPHAAGAALGAAVTGAAALAAAAVGLHAAGRRRAVLLAVAAGLADSCSAVVTMTLSHVASHGLAALATSWAGYALVVCGTGNVALTQFAYQAGRPMLTLPIVAAVTPLASVAVGAGLLGEVPRTGAAGAATAGLAVLVTCLALAYLARSVCHPGSEAAESGGLGDGEGITVGVAKGEHRRDSGPAQDVVGVDSGGGKRGVRGHGVVGGESDADGAACRGGDCGLEGDDHVVAAWCELNPASAVRRRVVAQHGEAERADIEAQRGVLVLDRDADGAHAGDVGLGCAHGLLLGGVGGMAEPGITT
jgi:drug/metabolite transporter (DMT)-like permease